MAALTRGSSFIPSSSAEFEYGTAGESITEGDPLYKDSTDSYKLKKCDANASLAASACVGLAEHSAVTGQQLRYVTKDLGGCVIGGTLAVGDTLWTSGTAGGITITPADNTTGIYVCVLGVAISTTAAKIQINNAGAIRL